MTRGTSLKAARILDDAVKGLDGAACLADGWQGSQGPLRIATAAFSCIGAMLPDVLKLLGFPTPGLFVDAFQTASGFVAAALGYISGTIDDVTGASNHTFTVHGVPLGTVTPTAANTFIAESQNTAGTPLHRPTCQHGCALSGDGTAILEHMTWSTWTGTVAVGTGMENLEDCNPDCASGGQYLVPVVVTFSHPLKDCTAQYGSENTALGGTRWFWTQATFSYPQGLPKLLRGSNAPTNPWVFVALIDQLHQSCGWRDRSHTPRASVGSMILTAVPNPGAGGAARDSTVTAVLPPGRASAHQHASWRTELPTIMAAVATSCRFRPYSSQSVTVDRARASR